MSRRLGGVAGAVAFAATLALVVLRPLLWTPGSLPRYVGALAPFEQADRNLNVWILAWTARAATEEPARLFDGNIYFPARNTLAGSETMLAHLPLTAAVWRLTRDATWVLKAEMAWGLAGTALAVLALARFNGLAPWAAVLAATAVALEPGRINRFGTGDGLAAQPQYLGFQFAPLALLALGVWHAGRLGAGTTGLAAALAAQALACFYLGYYGFLTVPLYGLALVAARPRPLLEVGRLAASVAAGAALVLPVAAQYVAARRAGAVRLPDPELAWLGSLAGAGLGAGAAWVGPLAIALGACGLAAGARRASPARFVRASWVMAAAAAALALGPELRFGGWTVPLPHRLLAAIVPGFAMLRGPLRALSYATLGLALAGGAALSSAGGGWRRAVRVAACAGGVAAALLWLAGKRVTIERDPLGADLPSVYRWLAAQPRAGGVLEVPGAAAEEDLGGLLRESRYMLYSTTHWHSLVNGYTAYPPAWGELAKSLARRLPERDALQTLVDLVPLEWVIVHRDELVPEQKAAWDAKAAAAGLVETARFATDVVYAVALVPNADWRTAVNGAPTDATLEGAPVGALPERCRLGSLTAVFPAEIRVGLDVEAVASRVENRSDCTWPALAVRPEGLVVLRAEWIDAPRGSVPPVIRSRLPHDLRAGESASAAALVLSPRVPGNYRLRLALVQEGETGAIGSLEGSVRVVGPGGLSGAGGDGGTAAADGASSPTE